MAESYGTIFVTMKTHKLSRDDYTRFMKDIDGARAEIKKSYFDAWGPCRLAAPSGRFVAMVRDGGEANDSAEVITTTAEGESAGSQVSERTMQAQVESIKRQRANGLTNRAPHPKACKCKDWPETDGEVIEKDDKGRPVSHRRACAWRSMYERQTGQRIKNVPAGPTFKATVHPAGKVSNPSTQKAQLMGKPGAAKNVKQKTMSIPRPDTCPKCSSFTKSKKMEQDQHHPTCEYFKKYKALSLAQKHHAVTPKPVAPQVSKKKNPALLFDLETQEAVRHAEPEEILEARRKLRDGGDDGIATIEVDSRQYLVMYEDGSSLEPAEPEEPTAPPAPSGPTETADTEPPPPDDVNEAYDPDLQGVNEEDEEDQTGTD